MTKKTPGVGFFGKVRIPTIGHKAAIDIAKKISKKNQAGLHIGLSGAAAPLTMNQKATHASKLFDHPVETHHTNILEFLSNMSKNHDHFTLVCGSDRAAEYKALMQRYNGNKVASTGEIPFSFKSWEVKEVPGIRKDIQKDPRHMSPDELVQSVSASKLEHLARKNNYEHFKAYHPGMDEKHVRRLFDQIRRGITLRESTQIPEIGQALSRDLMPQIDNTPKFLSFLRKNGIKSTKKTVKPTDLRASQSEFDTNKVAEIAAKKITKPIITSKDDHVADGHHRWLAGHIKKERIPTHQIDLPILDLLRIAREYQGSMNEEHLSNDNWEHAFWEFVEFARKKLGIKKTPYIEVDKDNDKSFGGYCPSDSSIKIVTKNRHPMDLFRTLAHELVHHKQNEDGRIKDASKEGATGSPIEDEANALAGRIMRMWAKENPGHFKMSAITEQIALFVVGGPCSGKDKIIRQLQEDLDIPEIDIQRLGKMRVAPNTMIVNGTADNLQEIYNAKQLLDDSGYYSYLLFADTTNGISKLRNEQRLLRNQRVLNEHVRFTKFTIAQHNKEKLGKIFENSMKIIDNNVSFDTRIGKGNKPEDREWGKPSTVRIYQDATPGQSPQDIAKWALPKGDKVLAKESIGQKYTPKKKIQGRKTNPDDQVDPLADNSQDGLGSTFAINRPPSSSVATFESIQKWAENPKTLERFRAKYGALSEQKLAFTVKKLQEASINGTTKCSPKSIKKIRESADMGIFDSMGTVPSQNKETPLGDDGKMSVPDVKKRKRINIKPSIRE